MRGRGEQAYAWAKASGIVGSSYLARRLPSLLALNRPSDLDRLLFPAAPLQLPERELSAVLQRRIAERSAARTLSIVDCFSAPAAPLVLLLRAYEYADLKGALAALISGGRTAPPHVDLGRYGQLRWEAYPDFSHMAAGTDFSWIVPPASDAELVDVESELDKRYYAALWNAVRRLPGRDRFGLEPLVAEEISLKNVVWSLRLRAYYGLSGTDLDGRLLDIRRGTASLAADARASADFALDRRADWQKWRRRALLNVESGGASWRVDPRAVQNAASRRLYAFSRRVFRSYPFSVASIAAFVRLMQFEEDILTSVAEGLALGLSAKEVMTVLEVSA